MSRAKSCDTIVRALAALFVVSAWRGSSMWNAISASVAIRLAYHLYQGPLAVVSIGPLGLIFAWYYATRGRILATDRGACLCDVLALLRFVDL